MTTTITDSLMVSDLTTHRAVRDALDAALWRVSWIRDGRVLTRDQALTAITIAELAAAGVTRGHEDWPLLRDLASELCLTADAALRMAGGGAQ